MDQKKCLVRYLKQQENERKRKMKTLSRILVGTALITGLNGCYPLQHAIKLKKYEPLSKEQKDSLLNKLNPGLKEYLKDVYVIDEKDLGKNSYAHTHYNKKTTICFSEEFKNKSGSHFHEAAHVRNYALDKHKSDFSKRWKKIADFKYGKKNIKNVWYSWPFILKDITWKDGTDNPKNGLLNPYSSTSKNEDAAEFVGCLSYDKNPEDIEELDKNYTTDSLVLTKEVSEYKSEMDSYSFLKNSLLSKPFLSARDSLQLKLYSSQLTLCSSIIELSSFILESKSSRNASSLENYSRLYPLYFADTTDSRYQQKLDLLEEYNFLTKAEHDTLSEKLGSLYYLREKDLEKPKDKSGK